MVWICSRCSRTFDDYDDLRRHHEHCDRTDPDDRNDPRIRADGGSDDPLEHADIGTTKTIRREKTLYSINYTPDIYFGHDRFVADDDLDPVDAWVDDDGDIRVAWEAPVTKRLPRRWNRTPTQEPPTSEPTGSGRRRFLKHAAILLGTMVPIMYVALQLTNRLTRNMTINSEPIGPLTLMDAVPIFLLFSLVTLLASSVKAGWPVPASIGRMGGRG